MNGEFKNRMLSVIWFEEMTERVVDANEIKLVRAADGILMKEHIKIFKKSPMRTLDANLNC